HPPELENDGLPATLEALAEGFGRRTGLETSFKLHGTVRDLPPVAELALLRVAQEALLNVYRHAKARRATLRLAFQNESTVPEVEDDGAGIGVRSTSKSPGVGLASMRTRVTAIGGSLSLTRSPSGFRVRVRLGAPSRSLAPEA